MRFFVKTVALTFGLCAASISNASEDKLSINWYHPDFPPNFILSGPQAGQGNLQVFEQGVIAHIPEYEHNVHDANMKRIELLLEESDNACSAVLFKTPKREKFVHFSIPYLFAFPVGIIIHQSNKPAFDKLVNSEGAISLVELMKTDQLMLGYSNGRSYNRHVDEIINQYANAQNSYKSSNTSISSDMLKMLQNKRFEYAIGFSFEGTWYEKKNEVGQLFSFYPIAEALNVQLTYMGCSKTPAGEKAINRINQELLHLRTDPAVYKTYLSWISEYEKEKYKELIEKGFESFHSGQMTVKAGS